MSDRMSDQIGDQRGLTALGAVGLALALGLIGGTLDVLTGPGLRTMFAVTFVAGSALAAWLVRRADLRVAVIMPPLVYVTVALIGGAMENAGEPGSFLTQQALELANALVLGAPVLLVATGLAVLIAVFRGTRGR